MSAGDGHRRRPADEIAVVEVPLVGTGDVVDLGPATPPGRPDWRRTLAVGLIGGAIAGTIGAAILLAADDDPIGDDATEVTDAVSAGITTPPTLEPAGTLPPAGSDVVDDAESSGATSPPEWDPYSGVTVPSYPRVTDVGLADLVVFDIAGAVDRLDEDRPRRSDTRLELGSGGFVIDVAIERDPVLDRYRIVVDAGGDAREAVIDVPGNRTLFIAPDGSVTEQSNDQLLDDVGTETVNEFFDALLLGPLRPESFNAAATRGRGLVTVDDVRVAREFATVVEGDLVPEWQIHAFGPVYEFRPEDRPATLEYTVYVSEAGDIVQVDGRSLIADVPQLVSHRITEPPGGIRIDLPTTTDGL